MTGTEKQIRWATKIKEEMLAEVNENNMGFLAHLFQADTIKTKEFIANLMENRTGDLQKDNQFVIDAVKEIVKKEERAEFFIEHNALLGFLKASLED